MKIKVNVLDQILWEDNSIATQSEVVAYLKELEDEVTSLEMQLDIAIEEREKAVEELTKKEKELDTTLDNYEGFLGDLVNQIQDFTP